MNQVKGIIPMGEGNEPFVFPLFDDGMHGDGASNDYHWGADFNFNAPPKHYQLIVKAWDPEDNQFENDLWFHHEGTPPPCEPIPHWMIAEGPHGNIEAEDVWSFYEEQPFAEWWLALMGPDFPPPPIFWQYHQVIGITLGPRPTTGYWIRIDDICIDHETDIIHVEYTEMVPAENCPVEEVVTTPYVVAGMMRYADVPIQWHKNVEIYDCPDCIPVPHEIIEEGNSSHRHDPIEMMIWNPNEWEQFYHSHKPGVPPPPINFENHGVAVIMLGDRPTGGFWVRLDEICHDDMGVHIRYTEMIPAPNCEVPQVVTQPYLFVVIKAMEKPYIFEGKEEIYQCPPPDCLEFWPLNHGFHSNYHSSVLKVINCQPHWETFWLGHHPDEPMPPVNFEEHTVVAVVIGDKPTTGFDVHIDWICPPEDPDQEGWVIQFTIEIPADNCEVDELITQPYDIVVAPKFEGPIEWIDKHHIYDCPEEDCLWFEPMVDGDMSGWHEQNLAVIRYPEPWEQFWQHHAPGNPPPQVNWPEEMVVALAMGDYPTTGYWVHLDEICFNDVEDVWVVDYTLEIPGESCDEDQVITQPFAYYFVERADGEFVWHGHEHVYECDD